MLSAKERGMTNLEAFLIYVLPVCVMASAGFAVLYTKQDTKHK